MTRLPKTIDDAVTLLSVTEGASVAALAPGAGYAEALGDAVGAKGSVLVVDPPPDLEPPTNVSVAGALPDDASWDVVILWLGTVPAHSVREHAARVSEGGALWTVLPKAGRDSPGAVKEADVKRALLAAGWKDDRTVMLSTEAYAIRFRKRR